MKNNVSVAVSLLFILASCHGSNQRQRRNRPAAPLDALAKRAPPDEVGALPVVNGKGYPDMFLRNYGVNPTIDTTEEPISTFSVDVDTGSFTLARGYLASGHLPEPDGIRVEEFLNAFDYGYPPPTQEPFSLTNETLPSPTRPGYHVLHMGLKGAVVDAANRKPANLVFVVDTSGSMQDENRLGMVKYALGLLVNQLRESDTVSMVAYGGRAYPVLQPTPGSDKERMLAALHGLTGSGSTNAQEGLELGYRLAAAHAADDVNSRVILCSDGVANNGIATDADGIFASIRGYASQGITLTAVGFGMGNYNDALMERLADQGDGFYAYVDRPQEARRIFVQALTGTLQVIAKDVKVQMVFDPQSVTRYRLLGYENRRLDTQDFANDRVDAGEMGAGHAVTALYEVKLVENTTAALGTLRIRYKAPQGGESMLKEWSIDRQGVKTAMAEASDRARLALVVAGLSEKLRGSYWARGLTYDQLLAQYAQLSPALAQHADVAELGTMIRAAKALDRRQNRFEHVPLRANPDFDHVPVLP